MGNFNRGGRSNDRRGGGFSRRGSRDGGRPEMFKAICDECGASCELPFKPTGDKPVYCSDCFRGKENSNPRKSSGRDFGRSGSRNREMFKAICDECGASCELPFKPSSDKPVYCSDCFGKDNRSNDRRGSSSNNQVEAQIKAINEKLDKILQILSISSPKEIASKKETKKPEVKKKSVVKKAKAKAVKKSKK